MRRGVDLLCALTLLGLTGCKTTSEHHVALPSQTSDADYRTVSVSIRGVQTPDSGPARDVSSSVPLHYKLFNHEQKLAVCGYYLFWTWDSCQYLFYSRWFDAAMFSANGKLIGSGGFVDRHEPSRKTRYEAGCVVTHEPWSEGFLTAPLTYQPGNVTSQCVRSLGGIR